MKMNLIDRLKRYSQKAIADALDPDFADAVAEAVIHIGAAEGLCDYYFKERCRYREKALDYEDKLRRIAEIVGARMDGGKDG